MQLYNVKIDNAIDKLKAMNAKKILLQLPDGLKPESFDIFNKFSEHFGVVISSGALSIFTLYNCIFGFKY